MAKEKSTNQWPQADDRLVVEEMLNYPKSHQWSECLIFIQKYIQMIGKNLSPDRQQVAVQEAMITVMYALPKFRFECKLATWLKRIAYTRMIDEFRKTSPSIESLEDKEVEANTFNSSRTIEEEYLAREQVREIFASAVEFIMDHDQKNIQRNKLILQKVFLEGYNFQQTAKEIGVSPPTVATVIHSIQHYLNEKRES